MRKHHKITSALCIVGLLGCDSERNIQRDVYQSKDDCMKDWEWEKLCEEEISSSSSSGSSASSYHSSPRYFGPGYYVGEREVELNNGEKIKPIGDHSSSAPILIKGNGITPFSRPVNRGGFSSGGSHRFGG